MDRRNELITRFSDAGLTLTSEQCDQFLIFFEMLVKKNEVMNLTSITEYHEVVCKHFLDSCMLLSYLPDPGKLIDVGTGAGFPGLPLKIMCADHPFVLLDSLNKRIQFIQEVQEALNLKHMDAVHFRAEEGVRTYRASFDTAVSRAVSNLSTLSEYCLPYVKVGGVFVSYKSSDVEEEVKNAGHALRILGGEVERIEKFSLPEEMGERSFVFIRKTKETPKKYPRKAGTPQKEPL